MAIRRASQGDARGRIGSRARTMPGSQTFVRLIRFNREVGPPSGPTRQLLRAPFLPFLFPPCPRVLSVLRGQTLAFVFLPGPRHPTSNHHPDEQYRALTL